MPLSSGHASHHDCAELSGRHVLVVDDFFENRMILKHFLTRRGATVSEAEDGCAAVDFVKNNPKVDLVLMDIQMPKMDGIDSMLHIRQLPQAKKLLVVAVTASIETKNEKYVKDKGFDALILKPVDFTHLSQVLASVLSANHGQSN